MVRKRGLMFGLLLAMVIVLAACSGGNVDENADGNHNPPGNANEQNDQNNDQQSEDNTNEPEDSAPAPKEDVEITFYSTNWDPPELFNFRFGDSLRKKFPNYEINYIQRGAGTHPEELIATKTEIDIFFQAISFYEAHTMPLDLHSDMTDLIKKQNVDLTRYEPTTIEAIQQLNEGKMFSLPVYGNTLVLFYNKDIFDHFGEDYPTDGMTWDETMDLAKQLTRMDENTQYIGLMHYPKLTVRMNPMSIPTIDMETRKPTINTDDKWKVFFERFFVQPVNTGFSEWLAEKSVNGAVGAFINDKNVAMYAGIASTLAIANPELEKFNWDLAAMPTFPETPGFGAQINSINFGITSMSSEREEAMEVLDYMGSEEFQTELARKAVLPVHKSQTVKNEMGKESPHGDKNYQALFYHKPAPVPAKTYFDADMIEIYQAQGVEVMLGNKDVNTARRDAQELAEQKIQELEMTR